MAIFQKSVVEKFLSELEESVIDSAYIEAKAYQVVQLKSWLQIKDQLVLNDSILALLHDSTSIPF